MFARLMVIDSRRTKKIAYILFQVLVSLSLLMVYILMLYEYTYITLISLNKKRTCVSCCHCCAEKYEEWPSGMQVQNQNTKRTNPHDYF